MKRRTKVAVILVVVFALSFFLVPVVPADFNGCPAHLLCPISLAHLPASVSISYYIVGIGARYVGTTYQILFWPGWICHPSTTINGGYDCHQTVWPPS